MERSPNSKIKNQQFWKTPFIAIKYLFVIPSEATEGFDLAGRNLSSL